MLKSNAAELAKISGELKKAVRGTLLLMYPDKSVLMQNIIITNSELQPAGEQLNITMTLQMTPRDPLKSETPAA